MREVDIELVAGPTHCRVDETGDGDWVVLVHGLITPQFAWHFLFDALVAEGYRVVSYDLYGHGESAMPELDYTFSLYLQQLGEVIQAFCDGQKIHLVGWSMGGALASLYAMKFGHQLRQMVLIAPGIVISSAHFFKYILQHKAAPKMLSSLGKQAFRRRLIAQFHQPERYTEYSDKATIQFEDARFWPALASTIVEYPENLPEILEYYPQTSPRPLIVWGEDDNITAYRDREQVLRLLGGTLLSIPDAAHAVHYEYPRRVNAAIVEYLAR